MTDIRKVKTKFMNKLYQNVLPLFLLGFVFLTMANCKKDKTSKIVTLPKITTNEASIITQTSAYCGGNITTDGGGIITDRGVCISTTQNPTIADNKIQMGTYYHGIKRFEKGHFRGIVSVLTPKTTYYIRAYATNSAGTAYGTEKSFYTNEINEVVPINDYDGNSYKTVKIGTQIWMAVNLRTTTLNDGKTIPNITDGAQWKSQTTEALCTYENTTNQDSIIVYGRLYNWYAVNTDKLCPVGWHVPSESEFDTLVYYLEGYDIAGGKLKEKGTSHWLAPNAGADNETGFTALGSGYRGVLNGDSPFYFKDAMFALWLSTEISNERSVAEIAELGWYIGSVAYSSPYKNYGYSVRCLKD
jgi:uncharacterized protein (TIGR02145 family)